MAAEKCNTKYDNRKETYIHLSKHNEVRHAFHGWMHRAFRFFLRFSFGLPAYDIMRSHRQHPSEKRSAAFENLQGVFKFERK